MPCTGSATRSSCAAARAMRGADTNPSPAAAVDCRNLRLFMASSFSLPHALAQQAFEPGDRRIHDHGQGGEHKHRDPDKRDVIGLPGIEDRAAEPMLGSDELA